MNKKITKILAIMLIVGVLILISSCQKNYTSIKQMQALEEGVDSPSTVQELEEAIAKYENRVNDIMVAAQQTGMWYKVLATRYLEMQMYGKALDALEQAVLYYPNNPSLYYYIGLSAGYMAKSALDIKATGDTSKSQNYINLAESAYLRALEIEPTHSKSLYGLSVLYVYELNKSDEAIKYLEKLTAQESRDISALYLLATAYYLNYEFEGALNAYDKILTLSNAESVKAEVEANKKIVLDAMYGN